MHSLLALQSATDPSVMTLVSTLLVLIKSHAWIPLAALVVGGLVRLAKSERIPALLQVPARYRVLAALVLGQAAAALQAIAGGSPWADAIVGGVVATAIAVLGHEGLIEGLRKGVEIGAGSPAAPKVPPLPLLVLAFVALGMLAAPFALSGCTPAQRAKAPGVVLTSIVDALPCVIEHATIGETDPGAIASECSLGQEAIKDVVQILAARKRGLAVARAKALVLCDEPALAPAAVEEPDAGTR